MSDTRDLLILGGGLVGMTLALAAARKGLSSHVIDRADPAELTAEGFDGRATAISTGALVWSSKAPIKWLQTNASGYFIAQQHQQ